MSLLTVCCCLACARTSSTPGQILSPTHEQTLAITLSPEAPCAWLLEYEFTDPDTGWCRYRLCDTGRIVVDASYCTSCPKVNLLDVTAIANLRLALDALPLSDLQDTYPALDGC